MQPDELLYLIPNCRRRVAGGLAEDHERTLRGIPKLADSRALTGAITSSARRDMLDAFRRGEIPILLLSPEIALRSEIQAVLIEAARAPEQKFGLEADLQAEADLYGQPAAPDVAVRFDDAALRYWKERKGAFSNGGTKEKRDLRRLQAFFDTRLLSEITDADVVRLIAERSKDHARPHNAPKKRKDSDYPLVSRPW